MLLIRRPTVTRGSQIPKILALSTSSTTIILMLIDVDVDVSDLTRGRRRSRNIDHSTEPEPLVAVVAEAMHVRTAPIHMLPSLRDDTEPPT
jgi:hypothetical protein